MASFKSTSTPPVEAFLPGTTSPVLLRAEGQMEFQGETFFTRRWTKEGQEAPRAVVGLLHGYAEYMHVGYERLALSLSALGLVVFGHDHLGHGKTSGEKVQTKADFKTDYVQPVLAHSKQVAKEFPGVPMFLVGHSMGGAITISSCLEEPELFAGAVVMGPMIEVDPEINTAFNRFVARMLSSVLPGMQMSGIQVDKLTRDKGEVEHHKADTLVWHGGIKLKQGWFTLKFLGELNSSMSALKLPMLIQSGEADMICKADGSKRLHDAIQSEDKTLTLYPGAYHSMYIEVEETRDAVIKETCDWIEKKLTE